MKQEPGYLSNQIKKKLIGDDFHVIVAEKIRSSHSNFYEAYHYGINHFKAGEFIIQKSEELWGTLFNVNKVKLNR